MTRAVRDMQGITSDDYADMHLVRSLRNCTDLRGRLRQHMVDEGMITREEARQSHAMENGLFGRASAGATPPPVWQLLESGGGGGAQAAPVFTGGFFEQVRQLLWNTAKRAERGAKYSAQVVQTARDNVNRFMGVEVGDEARAEKFREDADRILLSDIKTSLTDQQLVVDFWYERSLAFAPFEFGGRMNTDANGILPVGQQSIATFSKSFVESLRSDNHYLIVNTGTYISTAAFVDLARCEAVFCIPDSSLENILAYIGRIKDNVNDDNKFAAWYNGIVNHENAVDTMAHVADMGAAMKASLMQLRAFFMISDSCMPASVPNMMELRDYFDMGFNPWIDLIMTHLNPKFNALKGNSNKMAEFTSGVVRGMAPSRSVESFVEEIANRYLEKQGGDTGRKAQQLDLYYANLVHGASIKVPLGEIWRPNNEMEHSEFDTSTFFTVMWSGLKKVLVRVNTPPAPSGPGGGSFAMAEYTDQLLKSVDRVKNVKRYMKEIWEQSKSFRVSDRVHMTEVQILQRLRNDGVFQWVDNEELQSGRGGRPAVENLHACFYMRRFFRLFRLPARVIILHGSNSLSEAGRLSSGTRLRALWARGIIRRG